MDETDREYSYQFQRMSVVPLKGETANEIIDRCREIGAVYYEDGPDDECFVVNMRPQIGPEIWTASALQRSFTARVNRGSGGMTDEDQK